MATATTICLTLPLTGPPSKTALRLTRPSSTGSSATVNAAGKCSTVLLTRSDVVNAANNNCSGGGSSSDGCIFVRSTDGADGVYVTARAPLRLPSYGNDAQQHEMHGPLSILPLGDGATKISTVKLLTMILPTVLLFSMSFAWWSAPTCGLDALFPSDVTTTLVLKITVWICLLISVAYEHWWFWTTGPSRWGGFGGGSVEVEVTILGWADGTLVVPSSLAVAAVPRQLNINGAAHHHIAQRSSPSSPTAAAEVIRHVRIPANSFDKPDPAHVTTVTLPTPSARAGIELTVVKIGMGTPDDALLRTVPAVKSVSSDGEASKHGVKPGMVLLGFADRESVRNRIRGGPYPVVLEFYDLDGEAASAAPAASGDATAAALREDNDAVVVKADVGGKPVKEDGVGPASPKEGSTAVVTAAPRSVVPAGPLAPPAQELPPYRFIAAEKGDIESARRRYAETCKWRAEMGMDTIITEPHQNFAVIKKNWPHYYHLRGRNGEPCYYERPPDMNLKALKAAGITIEELLRHYALTCEFMWTLIEPSEDGKSIYVIDLNGMGMRDFAGEVVDFVKKTSAFTAAHYPERSGSIFVINVPSWFSIIWKTVKPWVDPVTQKKIRILGYGDEAITKSLEERIPIENIPPEYGGKSMPLGQSPEEAMFREKMEKNNRLALPDAVEEGAEHEHME